LQRIKKILAAKNLVNTERRAGRTEIRLQKVIRITTCVDIRNRVYD